MQLGTRQGGQFATASFAALLVVGLLTPRQAAAQRGHGGGRAGGGHGTAGPGTVGHGSLGSTHRGGSGAARSGVFGLGSVGHGVTAHRDAFDYSRLHDDALLVRHGLRVGVGLRTLGYYATPYYPYSSYYGNPYSGYPYVGAAASRTRVVPVTPGSRWAVPATESVVGDSLVVEERSGNVIRVSWRNVGQPVQEVALFLADTAETVLAVQTLRARPFTALFEPPPETALAGVTVVWPDGRKSTTLLPYR